MDKYIYDENNGLWYEWKGDYYISDTEKRRCQQRILSADYSPCFRKNIIISSADSCIPL